MPELKLSELTSAELSHRLSSGNLLMEIGPFVHLLHSGVAEVMAALKWGYGAYPVLEESIADSALTLQHTSLLRRFIRRKVGVGVDSPSPFSPMKAAHSSLLLETGLNWLVATRTLSHLILHSGVVANDKGAILFPGESGQGKSTLVAGLVLNGWRLFSDEFAVLDFETGQALPYPRPISLKNESIDLIRKLASADQMSKTLADTPKGDIAYVKPDGASVARMHEASPVTAVIIPNYDTSEAPRIERIKAAKAFMLMTVTSVNYDRFGAKSFKWLGDFLDSTPVYATYYGDMDTALAQVQEISDEA